MDRRAFLQSSSLAAAAGAAIANVVTPAAAETPGAGTAAHARDWSNRKPKGEPVVKRFFALRSRAAAKRSRESPQRPACDWA